MSTACFDLAYDVPSRLRELTVLTRAAKRSQEKNGELYSALCRSCCVLLAAHLEGFLKDLSTSITADLNFYLKAFDDLPEALQNTFCRKIAFYDGVPANEIGVRVNQLKSFFAGTEISIDLNAFAYKNSANKNPSGSVIERSLEKLGVPNVLGMIANDKFQVVFDGSDRTNYRLYRLMKRNVSLLRQFPYGSLADGLLSKKTATKTETIWHTFVEDLMTRRHNIVHGDIKSNEASWDELTQDIDKLGVLMYGLVFASTSYIVRGIAKK